MQDTMIKVYFEWFEPAEVKKAFVCAFVVISNFRLLSCSNVYMLMTQFHHVFHKIPLFVYLELLFLILDAEMKLETLKGSELLDSIDG